MTASRKALIVASDSYENEGLRRLRSPRADATALAAVLGDPQIGDFDVAVVHNEPSYEVQARLEDLFADSRPDDVLLVHFACHGLKNEAGELYFATRNTRLDRLGSTAVSADFVQRCMTASRSRSIVLLLDCCYGGAFGTGVSVRAAGSVNVMDSFPANRSDGGRGRAVITASSAMEYAFEGETLADDHSAPTSVFTEALVRGLSTGEADRDEDGWVSLNELYEYVFDQVRTSTPGQTPTRDVEMQGDLYLARSRRRRVQAAPVPPDLLAASHDSNVFTRLGAVSELRARLLGSGLPAAAGAHARLVEMAEGDIRYVADAAGAALAEATLGLDRVEIAYGEIPQGQPSPQESVVLAGPPFARACSYEASDRWLRVVETPTGFAVTVDTTKAGERVGSVFVRGPTGEGVVSVRGVVVATDVGRSPNPIPPAETAAGRASVAHPAVVEPAVVEPAVVEPTSAAQSAPSAEPASDTVVVSTTDRRVRGAALVALVGSVVVLVGSVTPFQWGEPLRARDEDLYWHATLITLLVAVTAGVALWGRSRWPAATGGFLGAVAASSWSLALLLSVWDVWLRVDGGTGGGLWLMLSGHVIVLAGGVLAVRAIRGLPGAALSRRPSGVLPWLILAAGTGGSIAAWIKAADGSEISPVRTATAWLAVLTLVAAVAGVLVRPRALGLGLLAGWVAGGVLIFIVYIYLVDRQGSDEESVEWFGLALVVVAVLTAVLAVRERAGRPRVDSGSTLQ